MLCERMRGYDRSPHPLIFIILASYSCFVLVGQNHIWKTASQDADPTRILISGNRNQAGGQSKAPIRNNGTLKCPLFRNGDSLKDNELSEMVYWEHFSQDSKYISPLSYLRRKDLNYRQYITFEPDEAGFNNVRLAMESAIAIALATGRVLVLPPSVKFHMFEEDDHYYFLGEFFTLGELKSETSLEIISFETFLIRVVKSGGLAQSFPPGNRTNWDGELKNYQKGKRGTGRILWGWLRNTTKVLTWKKSCIGVFPARLGGEHAVQLERNLSEYILNYNDFEHKDTLPKTGLASMRERFYEVLAGRQEICIYGKNRQNAKVLHIVGEKHWGHGYRQLVPFYAYFWENPRQARIIKRIIRDRVRYVDQLQCAAARIVKAIRRRVRDNGDTTGRYSSLHVRRGDFLAFSDTASRTAEMLSRDIGRVLQNGTTIYISTDEYRSDFFNVLRSNFDVVLIRDFLPLLDGINPNYFGMVEQLVAAQGEIFFGTQRSTFTGYIHRLRGYIAAQRQLPGNLLGLLPNNYNFAERNGSNDKHSMSNVRTYRSLSMPLWGQEFPAAWRGIDEVS